MSASPLNSLVLPRVCFVVYLWIISMDPAAGRFKNGSVPVLEVNGEQIAQSMPLLVYAGKLSGLSAMSSS
jgi:hypothetical protein